MLAALGYDIDEIAKELPASYAIVKQEEIQEVVFSKKKFKTAEDAKVKLSSIGIEPPKEVQDTPKAFRLRLAKPSEFKEDSLKEKRMGDGVKLVVGVKKESVSKQTEVQTLIFPKEKFTKAQALAFAKTNDFKSSKVDTTDTSFRLRQQEPDQFVRLRTISLPESGGVKAVVGPVKKELDDEERSKQNAVNKVTKAMEDEIMIMKVDDEKRIVTGVVLEPEQVDLEGDIISKEELEETAHFFLKTSPVVGFRHTSTAKASVVESYLAPVNFKIKGLNGMQKVKKGSWILSVHIPGDRLWKMVKERKIQAFSVGGFAQRKKLIKELQVTRVSLDE